jgi:cyclopropane fatty-acyl-phospholipid synthase-like methyltransferase
MRYDNVYGSHEEYFGSEPSKILAEYHHLIDSGKPVLDIGAGQGRHALFLARQGLTVEAIDPSSVGVADLARRANQENLPVETHCSDFQSFDRPAAYYSAVLLFGIIQEQPWEAIELLVTEVRAWLNREGLVFVTAFTVDDPSFERFVEGERAGKNSYINARGVIRTFLEPNEILRLFERFRVVHHWEGLGPIHSHGENPPERHATVQAVFRKA